MIDIIKLTANVRQIAQEEISLKIQAANFKTDGSYVTEVDTRLQQRLQQMLAQDYPYPLLAEEMSQEYLDNFFINDETNTFWCIDPLDGTSNFTIGLPFFSISLALIKDREIVFGLVYDPNRDECFTALKGEGAKLNGKPLQVNDQHVALKHALALVDLKRLDKSLRMRLILHPPYHSQRSFGSVALDWCWLAAERVHIYIHGKQRLWDYAAGLLIAEEAGCLSLGLDGKAVYQFNLEPRQVMGAVDKTLFMDWKEYLNITPHHSTHKAAYSSSK